MKFEWSYKRDNPAEVVRAENESKNLWIVPVVLLILMAGIAGLIMMGRSMQREEEMANIGKISAGSSSELIGEDYRTVEAHFEAAGFSNIEVIDLDDYGIAFWKDDKVSSISVGDKTSFSSSDKFDPGTKVVISHH